jgi:hypothetical protein
MCKKGVDHVGVIVVAVCPTGWVPAACRSCPNLVQPITSLSLMSARKDDRLTSGAKHAQTDG